MLQTQIKIQNDMLEYMVLSRMPKIQEIPNFNCNGKKHSSVTQCQITIVDGTYKIEIGKKSKFLLIIDFHGIIRYNGL